jgi:hypothetical protein
MSCLYSSPELKAFTCRLGDRSESRLYRSRPHRQMPLKTYEAVDHRVQQRRVPHPPAHASEPFIQPANTSPIFLRKSSSAIQAFVRLRSHPRRSYIKSQSRPLGPAFRNLSSGAALALESVARTSAFTRSITGPAPMLCPERSRSGAIFQEIFAFQSGFMGAFFELLPPLEYRRCRLSGDL